MFNKKKLLSSKSGISFEISYQRMGSNITFISDCDYDNLVCCDAGFGYVDDSGYHITNTDNTAVFLGQFHKGFALSSTFYENFGDGRYDSDDEGNSYVIYDAVHNLKFYGNSKEASFPIGGVGICLFKRYGYSNQSLNIYCDCIFPGSLATWSTNVLCNDNKYTFSLGVSSSDNEYITFLFHQCWMYNNHIYTSINPTMVSMTTGTIVHDDGSIMPDVTTSTQITCNNLEECGIPKIAQIVSYNFYGYNTYANNYLWCSDIDNKNKIAMFSCGGHGGGYLFNEEINDNKIHYTLDGLTYETLDYELPTTKMRYRWIKDSFWITGYEDYLYRVKVKGL